MENVNKCVGRWHTVHLFCNKSIESLIITAFFKRNRDMDVHVSLNMLHQTTKPSSSMNGESVFTNTC